MPSQAPQNNLNFGAVLLQLPIEFFLELKLLITEFALHFENFPFQLPLMATDFSGRDARRFRPDLA